VPPCAAPIREAPPLPSRAAGRQRTPKIPPFALPTKQPPCAAPSPLASPPCPAAQRHLTPPSRGSDREWVQLLELGLLELCLLAIPDFPVMCSSCSMNSLFWFEQLCLGFLILFKSLLDSWHLLFWTRSANLLSTRCKDFKVWDIIQPSPSKYLQLKKLHVLNTPSLNVYDIQIHDKICISLLHQHYWFQCIFILCIYLLGLLAWTSFHVFYVMKQFKQTYHTVTIALILFAFNHVLPWECKWSCWLKNNGSNSKQFCSRFRITCTSASMKAGWKYMSSMKNKSKKCKEASGHCTHSCQLQIKFSVALELWKKKRNGKFSPCANTEECYFKYWDFKRQLLCWLSSEQFKFRQLLLQ